LSMSQTANATRFTNVIGSLGVNTAVGGSFGPTGSAVTLKVGFDDLRVLKHSTHPSYWAKSKFIMSPDTVLELASVKDQFGNYLWALNNAVAGLPPTILGHEYVCSDFMNNPENTAASGVVVMFGDFSKYVITQQAAMNWLVDPITDPRQVTYRVRMREGSCLTDFQAVRALVNQPAAS
jgi:HK97 family phage major capsid protein